MNMCELESSEVNGFCYSNPFKEDIRNDAKKRMCAAIFG